MKNEKKSTILIIFLLFAILSSYSVLSLESPVLKTTILRYEPSPAQQGGYVTIYLKIENDGFASTENTKIRFVDNYPFSIDDPLEKTKEVGKISSGQTLNVDFKVRVDDKAISGINDAKFVLIDSTFGEIEQFVDIEVNSLKVDLNIKTIDVSPKTITPGDSSKITVYLKNTEDLSLLHVSSKLIMYITAGSTITDLPFAIEDSVSKKNIPLLLSGDETKIEYVIQSYPSITPGIYKIPLTFEFFDTTGTNYTKTEYVTVVVNPKTDSYITVDSTTLTTENRMGEVVFKVINKGLGEIKFTNLKLKSNDAFEILSPFDQVYIGSIDSDDYKTGEFKINAKKDKLEIPVTLNYKDSLNNDYEINEVITLNLLSMKQTAPKANNTKWIVLLAILIIIGIIWIVRRVRKNK